MNKIVFFLICISVIFSCSKSNNSNNPGGSFSYEKAVGTSAGDLLSATNFESIKIEIQYMTGFQPDAGAINHFTSFLNGFLNKPGGIQLIQKEIAPVSNTTLTVNDIISIEKQNRTVFTNSRQLGIYFLFTNGLYANNTVLGVAYRNTSMCLFGKRIHDNSGSIGQTSRTKLEATTLEHEFGHLLGLVDIGSPMQSNHKDAAHEGHCTNAACLMYYEVETGAVLGMLETGNIPALDPACVNDLQANGGK